MHAMQGIKLVPGCCLARRIDFFVLGYGRTAFVMFLDGDVSTGGCSGEGGGERTFNFPIPSCRIFRYHVWRTDKSPLH